MAPKAIKKQPPTKVTMDCKIPIDGEIFDINAFEKFLHDRIKVAGRTSNLGSAIAITRAGANITVTAASGTPFAKRYLKYLTKKFLKKMNTRNYLRVVSTKKDTYQLRYLVELGEDAEEEE